MSAGFDRCGPSVLSLAGTDPLSGAGVTADALVLAEHGVLPMTIATAFVVQNSQGVQRFRPTPSRDLSDALDNLLADRTPDVIKIGMTGSVANTDALRVRLGGVRAPIVLDPVLASGDGRDTPLAATRMPEALVALARGCALITPNLRELALLLQQEPARDHAELEVQARRLHDTLGCAVLAKGGHLAPPGTDLLLEEGRSTLLAAERPWPHDVHGTGCHLSSAIAAQLALGATLEQALRRGRAYLRRLWADGRVGALGMGRPQFLHASLAPPEHAHDATRDA